MTDTFCGSLSAAISAAEAVHSLPWHRLIQSIGTSRGVDGARSSLVLGRPSTADHRSDVATGAVIPALRQCVSAIEVTLNWLMLYRHGLLRSGDCSTTTGSSGVSVASFDHLLTMLALRSVQATIVVHRVETKLASLIGSSSTLIGSNNGLLAATVKDAVSVLLVLSSSLLKLPLPAVGAAGGGSSTPGGGGGLWGRLSASFADEANAATTSFSEWFVQAASSSSSALSGPSTLLSECDDAGFTNCVDGSEVICLASILHSTLASGENKCGQLSTSRRSSSGTQTRLAGFFQPKYAAKYIAMSITLLKQQVRLVTRREENSPPSKQQNNKRHEAQRVGDMSDRRRSTAVVDVDAIDDAMLESKFLSPATIAIRFRQLRYFRFLGSVAADLIVSLLKLRILNGSPSTSSESASIASMAALQLHHDVWCGKLLRQMPSDISSSCNAIATLIDREETSDINRAKVLESIPGADVSGVHISEESLLLAIASSPYMPSMELASSLLGLQDHHSIDALILFGQTAESVSSSLDLSDSTGVASFAPLAAMLIQFVEQSVAVTQQSPRCVNGDNASTMITQLLAAADAAFSAKSFVEKSLVQALTLGARLPHVPRMLDGQRQLQEIAHRIESIGQASVGRDGDEPGFILRCLFDRQSTVSRCLQYVISSAKPQGDGRVTLVLAPAVDLRAHNQSREESDDRHRHQRPTTLLALSQDGESGQCNADDSVDETQDDANTTKRVSRLREEDAMHQTSHSDNPLVPAGPTSRAFEQDVASLRNLLLSFENHRISHHHAEAALSQVKDTLAAEQQHHAQEQKKYATAMLTLQRERDHAVKSSNDARSRLLEESAAHAAQVASLTDQLRERDALVKKLSVTVEQLEGRVAKFEQLNHVIRTMTGQLSSSGPSSSLI